MSKFHVNEHGNAGPCTASVRACQFGESDHFETREAANTAAGKRLAEAYGVTPPSLKKRVKDAAIRAFVVFESFAESVDTGHKRDMEEIRELAYQRKNTTNFK